MTFRRRSIMHFDFLVKGNFSRFVHTQEKLEVSEFVPKNIWLKRGNFVDVKIVKVYSGKGGNGSTSILKLRGKSTGPPAGGNGGRGGDVYISVNENMRSLYNLKSIYKSQDGIAGGKNNMSGRNGEDLDIYVPSGTIVTEIQSEKKQNTRPVLPPWFKKARESKQLEYYRENKEMCDSILKSFYKFHDFERLTEIWILHLLRCVCKDEERLDNIKRAPIKMEFNSKNDRSLILKGGAGGAGSTYFWNQALGRARIAKYGSSHDPITLKFELKIVADVGLVGLTNAGKSSLLSALTRATPLISDIPFTTLRLNLGVVNFTDCYRMVVADVPGLVEGAHMNKGLGHAFLRHVERNTVHAYVLDLSLPSAKNDLDILREEVRNYSEELANKPYIIIGNKADLNPMAKDNFELIKSCIDENIDFVPASAKELKNIDRVAEAMRKLLESVKPPLNSA